MHAALSAPSLLDRQGLGDEPRQGLGAHLRLERRLDVGQDAAVQGRYRGAGLVDGDLRLQAGEQVEPVVPAVLEAALVLDRIQPRIHRERHEDHGRHVDRRAAESGRRHTDHDQRLAVDQQHLSEHVARATQLVLPELVAQDGDRMAAERLVDFRAEQSPQSRRAAQRREVRAGDLHPLDNVQASPPPGNAKDEATVRRDVCKGGLFPLQVTEHRIAEHLVASAGPVAEVGTGLRSRRLEIDQPLRLDSTLRGAPQPVDRPVKISQAPPGIFVGAAGERYPHRHDAVRRVAALRVIDGQVAPRQQQRIGQENRRQRELRDDQQPAQRPAAGTGSPTSPLHHPGEIELRAAELLEAR